MLAARGLGGEGGGGGGLFGGLMGGGGAPDETYVTVSWKGKEVGRTPVAKRGKGATDGGGEGGGEGEPTWSGFSCVIRVPDEALLSDDDVSREDCVPAFAATSHCRAFALSRRTATTATTATTTTAAVAAV